VRELISSGSKPVYLENLAYTSGPGTHRQCGWKLRAKRLFDCCVAICSLVLFWPLFLVIWFATWLSGARPVFFWQRRPGRWAKPFTLYKFATMSQERNAGGDLLPDEVRLTRTGRIVRRMSLDELPQLWNVLRGDMSLVGPRPLLMEYLDRYTPEQARRHEVMPGITGWVQVNGRNALSWEEKFKLDNWYVDHWSLWLDLKILWLTALQLLRRVGINHEGHATMPAFAPRQTFASGGNQNLSTVQAPCDAPYEGRG
jgi:sugar transferase EpsL